VAAQGEAGRRLRGDGRIVLATLVTAALLAGCDVADGYLGEDRYSKAAFDRWLTEGEGRKSDFKRFEALLAARGVKDVVPAWQLLRTDSNYAWRCGLGAFEMPPEAKWQAIVPALRLVRDDVIPVVGRVEVSSAYRSHELNDCVNGAKGSRHLAFEAVDLVAPERADKPRMYAELCAMHRRVGAQRGMGLGAYYDSDGPASNQQGRFHIDGSGFRTWGFDFTRKSSACLTMRT
jgi:hypothetical protein